MSVWLDGPWMLYPDGDGLADEIAERLASASNGLSCDDLAERLGRRRSDVLEALRRDARFVHSGRTSQSRWRVESRDTLGASGTERDGTDSAHPYSGLPLASDEAQKASASLT